MRKVLLLGHHDVRLFMREPSSYVWLFLVPLVFVYFMGLAVRGPGGPSVPRPTVAIDNQDTGFLGRILLKELGEQGLNVVGPKEAGRAERGITVPPDFTQRVLEMKQSKLSFFKVEGSSNPDSALVEVRLMRALVALNGRLVEHAVKSNGAPPTEEALTALMQEPDAVSLKSSFAGRRPMPVGFSLSLPGTLVMYLFFNLLIFGGASVANERRTGVLRRLAVNPVTRRDLVFGKMYGLVLLAGVQIVFFMVVGQYIFGVNVRANLVGIVLTLLVLSWVASAVGVLIGSLVTAEEKVIGLCLLVALPMAALGGCWWPIEIVPKFLQYAALATPTGWAMAGLHQLITFGGGLADAAKAIVVLACFGIAANVAAMRWFRV
jgi:ABC-type multidrug transport system permease subunit